MTKRTPPDSPRIANGTGYSASEAAALERMFSGSFVRLNRQEWAAQFGSLVRARRKKRRLTLDGLGALVGVHEQSVWRWEHGEQLPDAFDLARLADALGCAVRTLLPRKEAPPPFATQG